MDILKWKCISIHSFASKQTGMPLHSTDIIYGTDLIKIGEGNMPMLFINPYRSDGGLGIFWISAKPPFSL
mgnify:CR=1 FL=1